GNQSNGNASTKACDDACKARMETVPGKDYILLPLWTTDPPFSQSSKSSPDAGFKPSGDDKKKVTKDPGKEDGDPSKEGKSNDQEKEDNVNSTNTVNAASTNKVNAVGGKSSIELLDDPNMLALEDYNIFDLSSDDQDVGAEADINNLDAFMSVSPIPTTRIHKDHPVAQGYTQEEGIDYDEVFSPIARIEVIRLFLAYASFKDFMVYQMDVKSAFLYGKIEEEVYVCQPPGFEDPNFPDRVYKVEKELYGLHQAPRADSNEKKLIQMIKIHTDKNVADLLTKAFDKIVDTEHLLSRIFNWKIANGFVVSPNATIFELLTTHGAKTTAWNEFSSTMASAIICLANNQKFNFSKYIFESMMKNLDSAVKFLMYPRFVQVFLDNQLEGMINHNRIYIAPSHTKKNAKLVLNIIISPQKKHKPRKPKKKDTQIPQSNVPSDNLADEAVNEENVSKHSNDPLLSGEDRLKLKELMALCTNLQNRVLDLEHTKTTQALEIDSLKRRVKKLEKKQRSRTHRLRRLYKVGLSARVVSSEDEGLGEEDASKQGRKIHDIDADEDITLENVHDEDMEVSTADLSYLLCEVVLLLTVELVLLVTAATITMLQAEEQEELTIEEKSKTVSNNFGEKEGKPLQVNTFVDMDTELVRGSEVREDVSETREERSSKRTDDELEQEPSKKQKMEDDKETIELQSMMEVIPDEEEVAVDAIPLATKPSSIVDWNIIKEGKIGYY
ncbi:retrovirus-related pol polyprotein from transposon TNT 1-94, partial [Tanacetum coccineum]